MPSAEAATAAAAGHDWYSIVVPALLTSILAALGFVTHYFTTKSKEEAPSSSASTSDIVAKSVGAAFVDSSVAAAIMRIDATLTKILELLTDFARDDHDRRIIDAATKAAAAAMKGEKP